MYKTERKVYKPARKQCINQRMKHINEVKEEVVRDKSSIGECLIPLGTELVI